MAAKNTYFTYRTPYGPLTLASDGRSITAVALGAVKFPGSEAASSVTNLAANELQEYFAGKRTFFSVSVNPSGSAFQKSVWAAIAGIPYGETMTNAEIAALLPRNSSSQAVGTAVKRNPCAILIPAHRVVGENGRVAGADKSARLRQTMLDLERKYSQDR